MARTLLGPLALIGLGVWTACRAEAPPPPPAEAAAAPAPVSAPAPAGPVARALDTSAIAPFRYAGITIAVTGGAVEAAAGSDAGSAEMTLHAKAPPRLEVPLDQAEVTLTFANGSRLAAALPSLGLDQEVDIRIAGTVPRDTVWEGARLVAAEAGRLPEEVVVGAPPVPLAEPLDPGDPVTIVNRYGERVGVAIESAAIERDGPVSGGFFRRAGAGERFLRLRVTAVNQSAANGVSVGEEVFSVSADGTTVGPAAGVYAKTIPLGQSSRFDVIFKVPAEWRELALVAGTGGRVSGTIRLSRRDQAPRP